MKRLNKLLILLIMIVGFVPFIAKAAPANVTSWRLKCDKVNGIHPNEKVKCHVLGNLTEGSPNIKYLITRVTGKAIKVTSAGSNTHLSHFYTDTEDPYASSNTVPRAAGATCPINIIGCYDWYKQGGVITRDVSSPISTGEYATANDFAYYELELIPDLITSDVDCARICVYIETMYDGESTTNGELTNPTTSNGGCIELHLEEVSYCSFDGTNYYDNEGKVVTKEEYERDCNPHCKCEGGKCYNKNGKEVSNTDYLKDCGCRIEGGKYYDDQNKEVTPTEYNKVCNPHCKCDSKGQCYDNNGNPVTKDEYNKICNPTCYCDNNGQCYDDNGKPVTPEEYKKMCGCRIENGKYYDDTGKETDEATFLKKCNPHCYCNKEGQCYDGKGKPVTIEQYQKACGCRKENGKFYDDKGNEVDEKTWNAKCVPKTGSSAPYVSILVLLLGSYGIFNIIKYYRNNKKIYKV